MYTYAQVEYQAVLRYRVELQYRLRQVSFSYIYNEYVQADDTPRPDQIRSDQIKTTVSTTHSCSTSTVRPMSSAAKIR